ncbi:MAG: penicillin-binding transpeptidase domain-containing protein, partial [Gemmatimonas sp.]
KSLNVPAVRVASDVGVDRVQNVWHEAGISGELSNTPAIALGVDDITMRELVSAYTIFPNLGSRSDLHLIESVEKGNGKEMYKSEVQRSEAIDPAVAYVIHALMRGVVIRGTAARLNEFGLEYAAGKTGTTSNYRDAWFVGYTPDLLTGVWVGFDDGTPLRISSGEAAVPIWAAFMTKAPHQTSDIKPPDGVSVVEVEAATGRVWQPGCGPSVAEAFLTGTEPHDPCGGVYDGSQLYTIYEEPPMITDEAAAQIYPYDTSAYSVERVHDPDLAGVADLDTADVSIDTTQFEPPRVDSSRIRQDTLRRGRSRVISPPVVAPPARADTPIVSEPAAPPPPPKIPPKDSSQDSLAIRIY